MQRIVHDAVDTNTGDSVYFKTHAKVVYASDGVSVHRHVDNINSNLNKFNVGCESTQNSLQEVNNNNNFVTTDKMNTVLGDLRLSDENVE